MSEDNHEVEPEHNRKVYIGSLSYRIDENTFRDYWTQFGNVLDAKIVRDREGNSRGFGFVTFENSSSVDDLMKARPHTLDNRIVEAKRTVPRGDLHKSDTQSSVKKLYVGGIKEPLTEDDLKDYFSKYGAIADVIIMKDREGQYRGFGFIEFDDYDPVDKIILDRNHTVCGQQLTAQKASTHRPNGNTRPYGNRQPYQQRTGGPMRRGNLRHNYTPYNNRDDGSSWSTWE